MLLTAEDAALAYRGRRVLDGVDLALAPAETVALLGPNGAGKTTLMRLLAGRLRPDTGRIRVAGRDPHADRAVRAAIGWVPQEIALYDRLTVAENLGVFASLAGVPRSGRRAAVAAALALAEIEPVAGRLVGQLSGGYRRRVNLAASLMNRPPLVLLDEPTQGVDLAARAAIHAVLQRLGAEGTAILIATHDFAEAERLAHRVAFMSRGRIVREGVLAAMLADLRTDDLELKRIYLLSRFHGGGTGRRLMQHAVDEARSRGAGRLLLGVYAGNERALAFYARCGYVRVGERRFQVGANTYEDAILALDLTA